MNESVDAIKTNTLHVILQLIYCEQRDNAILIDLLRFVAVELRRLHDKQIILPNLNNNTLLIEYYVPTNWQIITIVKNPTLPMEELPLTFQQRAQNLASLDFPDDYWRIFKHMYFYDQEVPLEFNQVADQLRSERRSHEKQIGISEQDIWLWDEKSAQAMVVLNRKSKKHYRKLATNFQLGWRVLKTLPKLYFTYRKLLRKSYQRPVTLTDKIGVALMVSYQDQELLLLESLGNIPVLLRFYCHENEQKWQQTTILFTKLRQKNIKVSVALVQDREAVINIERWQRFLQTIMPVIAEEALWIEVGHASNRVKWGIWQASEYVQLMQVAAEFKKQYPNIRLIGPAVIDFEWYRIIDIVKALPKKLTLFAISQHLYVDRRGAPENYQGKFSTVEKCAMGKAIANISPASEDRFIITEVNWPLKNTGIWSPIGSPYTAPVWFRDRPGVTEEDYASYLIRYLAIALCSGFTEQIFLWRLSAHGYGLVDDRDKFRKRPAFFVLQQFLRCIGEATFVERLPSKEEVYLLQFKNQGDTTILAWTSVPEAISIMLPWIPEAAVDQYGNAMNANEKPIIVTEQPCYYIKK